MVLTTHNKLCFVLLFVVFCITYSTSQERCYYTGHSLISLDIPYQTQLLVEQSGLENDYRNHINNGASIKLNWIDTLYNLNPIWDPTLGYDVDFGTNHRRELLSTPYDYLVMTEAVPLLNYSIDTTVKYMSNFINLAHQSRPDIRSFVYATWEGDVSEGSDWVENIRALIPAWERIRNELAIQTNTESIYIIPGNLAMIQLSERLEEGPIGSLHSLPQLFEPDGIHPNFDGKYFMSCLFAASIYNIDPRGLPPVKAGPYSNANVILEDEVRRGLQSIAYDVACYYEWSGLFCVTASSEKNSISQLAVYPNPVQNSLQWNKTVRNINIYNSIGVEVLSSKQAQQLNVAGLNPGFYHINWQGEKGQLYSSSFVKY